MLTEDWIIGFVDGEGYFGVRNVKKPYCSYNTCVFQITQKDREVLEKIKDFFGFGNIYSSNAGYHIYQVSRWKDIRYLEKFFNHRLQHPTKREQFEKWRTYIKPYVEPKYKKALRLRLEGFSYRKIADVLNVSVKRVGTYLWFARHQDQVREYKKKYRLRKYG